MKDLRELVLIYAGSVLVATGALISFVMPERPEQAFGDAVLAATIATVASLMLLE